MPMHAWQGCRRRSLVIAVAALAIAGLSAATSSRHRRRTRRCRHARQVTVIGSGEVQGTPDTLTVNVSIDATAPDVTAASNQTSSSMQAVIDALVGSGIDRKDISTTQVTLQPQYGEPTTPPPSSATRRATRSASRSASIDTASTALGADPERGRQRHPDQLGRLTRSRTTRSWSRTRGRAPSTTPRTAPSSTPSLSGLRLGKVISISEAGGDVAAASADAAAPVAAEAVPLEPGQQTVGFAVTVIWELAA